MKVIFVFGSNLAGLHGAGAAHDAVHQFGAIYGQGVGRQGNSYAIPTKDSHFVALPLSIINAYIQEFLNYAEQNPNLFFLVTRIGCGLAGYTEKDIKPMFAYVSKNVQLPNGWYEA